MNATLRISRALRRAVAWVSTCVALSAAAQGVQVVSVPGGLVRVPDAAAQAAAPGEGKTPWRMVARPEGIERVIDGMPATSAALAGNVAAPAVRSRSENGASERVLPGMSPAAAATLSAGGRSAWTEEALPNGARRLVLPNTASVPAATSSKPFPVIDVDAAGRTQWPVDAMRNDVLLRRVPDAGAAR